MKYYVFPFEKVEKNSRVVLCGADNAGMAFYNQIKETDFCKIVLWIDKNINEMSIKPLSEITKINENSYDIIIIATELKTTTEDIKVFLLNQGIPENKILCMRRVWR